MCEASSIYVCMYVCSMQSFFGTSYVHVVKFVFKVDKKLEVMKKILNCITDNTDRNIHWYVYLRMYIELKLHCFERSRD